MRPEDLCMGFALVAEGRGFSSECMFGFPCIDCMFMVVVLRAVEVLC